MSGELEPWQKALAEREIFEDDRGIRSVLNLSLPKYFALGEAIRQYQKTHPNTLVRVTQKLSRSAGTGMLIVKWWQRGTKEP